MTEINGLANLLNNAGTLHTIKAPDREDFSTDAEYKAAYWAANCWHASTRPRTPARTSPAAGSVAKTRERE